jgi:ABC-type sugar transport system substrate-binding protein/tetratricopeptide (TPR) repeat protein
MAEQVPFIDREDELALIDKVINEWDTRRIVCVGAPGGIGKTRLLQEVRERYLLSAPPLPSDKVEKKKAKLALVLEFTPVQEWFGQFVAGAREMSAKLGAELVETYANFDLDKMVADLEDVILKSPDAIIIDHGSSEKLRPGIQRAIKLGIKILTFDNNLQHIDGLTTRVSQDDYEGARLSLGALAEDINFQGKIAVIFRKDIAPLVKRKSILDNLLLRHPDIAVEAEYGTTGPNVIEDTYHQTKEVLRNHPDIQAFWATWDEYAKGAAQALIEEGRTDIPLYSFDLGPSDIDLMLKPGSPWRATAAADAMEAGRVMVRLAVQAARGVEIKRYYSIPMKLIARESLQRNIDDKHPLWDESDIGWTLWLRSMLAEEQSRSRLLVADIIDFDDRTYHVPSNIERRIAQMLGENAFEPYLRSLADYRKMEMADVSQEQLTQMSTRIAQVFISCFNTVTAQQRVVLFLDTFDAVKTIDIQNYLLGLVIPLKDVVLLIAGRTVTDGGNVKALWESLQPQLGLDVQFIDLPPLKADTSAIYLQQKQNLLHITLEPSLAQKLLLLAEGRPILIDLAVEWMSREIPLGWLVESRMEELAVLSDETKKKFESQLVHHISDTRHPMDWLILMMARIYPLDIDLIARLLGISEEAARGLFEEAKGYTFVKSLPDGRITLHDEMRRMVNEYVWPEVDPDGDRQRRDSQLIVACLEDKARVLADRIQQLEVAEQEARREKNALAELNALVERGVLERELWVLRSQQLDHTFWMDTMEGVEAFTEMFDATPRGYRASIHEALVSVMESHLKRVSLAPMYELDSRRIAHLLDIGQYSQAKGLAREVLKREGLSPERQVNILTRLANCARFLGSLPEAVGYLEQSLAICDSYPEVLAAWGGSVLNFMGLVHRLIGKWDQAVKYYRRSIDLLRTAGNEASLAAAYNNLGYLIGLQSNYDSALIYCHRALATQESLNLRYDSGRTHNTLGIIYRSKGSYADSLKHTNQALTIFEEFGDYEWLSKAYCERGITRWYMGQLQEADEDLEKSYQVYIETGLRFELANTLHRRGHVAWDMGNLEKAEDYFRESAKIGEQVSDYQQTVNSLQGLVELYYFMGNRYHEQGDMEKRDEWYAKAESLASQWEEEYEKKGYYFPLYSGSRIRILGNIAHDREDYDTALQRYLEAYPHIASRGGYSKYMLPEALDRLQRRIDQLPAKIALQWCDRIQEYWKEKDLDGTFPEMITVCEIGRDNANARLRATGQKGS